MQIGCTYKIKVNPSFFFKANTFTYSYLQTKTHTNKDAKAQQYVNAYIHSDYSTTTPRIYTALQTVFSWYGVALFLVLLFSFLAQFQLVFFFYVVFFFFLKNFRPSTVRLVVFLSCLAASSQNVGIIILLICLQRSRRQ